MATSIIKREQEIKLGTLNQGTYNKTSATGNIDTGLTSPVRILSAWNYSNQIDCVILPWKGYNQHWYFHVMSTAGETVANTGVGTIAYQYLDSQ